MPILKKNHPRQMSDSYLTAVLIVLSGGLQDAYTYFCRGQVFANAQTGNIVLMSAQLASGQWLRAVRYLIPLLCYVGGTVAAEMIHTRLGRSRKVHWRQLCLLGELLVLLVVGFLPQDLNILANAMVSFACAMQVQAFQKVHGYRYASTMCIGNLRSGTAALCDFFRTRDPADLHRGLTYFAVIVIFAVGAGVGYAATAWLGQYAIWVSCGLLLASCCILFIRSEA